MSARPQTARRTAGITTRVAVMAATMVTVVLCTTLFCSSAIADTVRRATYDHVRISALVEPDGDLRVRERFTVSYKGTFHGMYWVLDDSNPEILSAGEYVDDKFVPYKRVYTNSDEPGTYSTSTPSENSYLKRVDLHIDKTDETAEYLLEYRLPQEAYRWADASELRWESVGDSWDNTLNDVVCDLYVQRPEDTGTWRGENVFAWLYHSAETIAIEDVEDGVVPPELIDGKTPPPAAHVHYEIDAVGMGGYNLVTVLFPADWLFDMSPSHTPRRSEALQEKERDIERSARLKAERGKLLTPTTLLFASFFVVPFLISLGLSRLGINLGRHGSDSGGGGGSGGGSGGGGHGGGSY